MNKKFYLIVLLVISTSTLFAQQAKKASPSAIVYKQLTEDKKIAVKNIQEKYSEAMQELLKNTEDPISKREKVYKLQIARDSSLKAVLGEPLYEQYRKPVAGSRYIALPSKKVQSAGKDETKLFKKSDELPEQPGVKPNQAEIKKLD